MVNATTKVELEPLFFTFVISAAATSPGTRVLGLGQKFYDTITHGGVVIVLQLYSLEQCLKLILGTLIKTRNFVTFYEFLIHLGMHHTSRGNGNSDSSSKMTKTTAATAMAVGGNTTIN